MLFNSLSFVLFFVVVYLLYCVLTHRFQNLLLLFASYFFYGCWDWRFLSLIFISTVIDYFCGLAISRYEKTSMRKLFLSISMIANLGILFFFKYFGFFADSLNAVLASVGIDGHIHVLRFVLPVGISFYTFQTMSYTIDIYRNPSFAIRRKKHLFLRG